MPCAAGLCLLLAMWITYAATEALVLLLLAAIEQGREIADALGPFDHAVKLQILLHAGLAALTAGVVVFCGSAVFAYLAGMFFLVARNGSRSL